MERCTTSFSKEWEELKIHKEREVISGVKVILDKEDKSHIIVYLDGLRNVPPSFEYKSGRKTILLHADTPDNYDCTEDDKMKKIAEAVANAEFIYDKINREQIINLQSVIDAYNVAKDMIYSAIEHMR